MLTSVTGFGFPVERLLPSHVVGVISLVVLAVAVAARYFQDLRGGWRTTWIVCAAVALYLNVFVGVVQAFRRIAPLEALAPKQTELPFVLAQGLVFAGFIALGRLAALRGRATAR